TEDSRALGRPQLSQRSVRRDGNPARFGARDGVPAEVPLQCRRRGSASLGHWRRRAAARLIDHGESSMRAHPLTAAFAALVALQLHPASAQQPAPARTLRPVTEAMLANPDPGDWLSWRRTRNHWAYSPLDQVSTRNVAQLRLVWTRPLGQGVQEGTPLVHDGVMFFPNPSDITQA